MSGPPERCDVAVVGGGILGLAVARELLRRRPDRTVCVLEREPRLAAHQTGHNSGVIHAGVYYAPGSLKARLCVAGARELYELCARHGVPHVRCGKLVIATRAAELGRLDELERRARANGVAGLRRLDAAGIREIEPHARGRAGLHSPATGVVDFAAVAHALAADVRAAGGTVACGCGVRRLRDARGGVRVQHARGTLVARAAVCCAGAWADRLAAAAGDPDPRIVPFRGAYLRLSASSAGLVRALVYPVPEPRLPFLGVHLTRRVDGEVLIGPTALLAAARATPPAGRGRLGAAGELAGTLAWPGTWRMFATHWRAGLVELLHAAAPASVLAAAARLVPAVAQAAVEPAFAGIRAQAVGRDGRLVDDFVFARSGRTLHVRNAPSPAATASLAIARHVVDRAGPMLAES